MRCALQVLHFSIYVFAFHQFIPMIEQTGVNRGTEHKILRPFFLIGFGFSFTREGK